MRVAYFDCLSGIAGDMTLAALIDLGLPLEDLQEAIDSLGLPSCNLRTAEVKRKGFRAVHLTVEHEPEHAHRHLGGREFWHLFHRSRYLFLVLKELYQ